MVGGADPHRACCSRVANPSGQHALHFPGLPFALSAVLCMVALAAVASLPGPPQPCHARTRCRGRDAPAA